MSRDIRTQESPSAAYRFKSLFLMARTARFGSGAALAGMFVLATLGVQLMRGDTASAQAANQVPATYKITPGDKLTITVFEQPELSGDFVVDQNGAVRLPMVGDIAAGDLTPDELEPKIADVLRHGFIKNPVVGVRVSEFNSINVIGMVHRPGSYPYRQGMTVLTAIAQAGGIGLADASATSLMGEVIQSEERVRMLELSRASLMARRVRLTAQQQGSGRVEFPDMSRMIADSSTIARIVDGERREFEIERETRQRQIEALRRQIPRLRATVDSIAQQQSVEQRQRQLNEEIVGDLDGLLKKGLTRKPAYIESKREELRIDGRIAGFASERLKTELQIDDIEFRIDELDAEFRRRTNAALQETDRALIELAITLPSAQRTQTFRVSRVGLVASAEDTQRPPITVVRQRNGGSQQIDVDLNTKLRPGDIVQVGTTYGNARTSAARGDSLSRSASRSSSPEDASVALLPIRLPADGR
jgi:polysaccharide export outer membrane protein